MIEPIRGLCYRCEYRARVLEGHSAPRAECAMNTFASFSCYMYRPVKPVVLQKEKMDKRPLLLNILSCRVNPVGLVEGEYRLQRVRGGWLVWWSPNEKPRKGK